ncbi:MAG: pyruvate kinase alpha/beta domain-containing protein, partial [Chthoniobacterales bacterium]
IFAFTPSEHICRQLALCWGTHPVLLEFASDPNATIEAAAKYLREAGLTRAHDNLVILSDLRAGNAQIDSIQVRQATDSELMEDARFQSDQESMMD